MYRIKIFLKYIIYVVYMYMYEKKYRKLRLDTKPHTRHRRRRYYHHIIHNILLSLQ